MTRDEQIAALFARAAGRAVWGMDARGRGGRWEPGKGRVGDWKVPAETVVLAWVEGEPEWERIDREPD